MLTPEQIDKYPDNLVELYSQAEMDIIADIARRISTYDYFIPSAEHQYRKLMEMNNIHDEILKRLTKLTGLSKREIENLMFEAGYESIKFDDKIYKKAGLSPSPIEQSPALLSVLDAGIHNTSGLFENLTRTTASTVSKQFENILDNAYMQITTGAFDANTAIRNAVKDLAGKGLASIAYPNGHVNYVESAVRRAVMTGVNQTALKMQEARAQEMGSDLVETSAHAGARPSHAVWQGKVFSLSGTHPKYPDFKKETGYGTGAGLGGWNCRHNFYPFFEGLSEPAYSKQELKQMTAKDYEYNDEKMTEYEATQKQRAIERKIRRWKREYKGMDAAGLPTDEAASKISQWQNIQKDFLKQTGLKVQSDREQIPGFGKSEAQKVLQIARKEKERVNYETIIKPGQPKILKVDDIELQYKTEYDIIKNGITIQGIVPTGATATNVRVMAGYGSSDNIRVAKELSKKYGGDYWKWQKKTGTVESSYRLYEVHWYEYNGKQYRAKLKRVKEK
nr:MAG TPA: minor capsid protein [Caudoviricetes sp.]